MGGGDKTTIMVLKVDLQCCSCYKKVKKILCKFPQIRDQVYDEKANTVTITVVCCNPEKLRDKLCCKGCGVIKSIEIKEPPKPKQPEEPKKPTTVIIEKPKEPEKPKVIITEKPKELEKPKTPEPEKPKEASKPQPVAPSPTPEPVMIMPMPMPIQIQVYPPPPPGYCCGQCYEGHTGGPCYQLYGRPVPPPPPCYDNYGYSYGRGCYVSRCEQNATGCSIM